MAEAGRHYEQVLALEARHFRAMFYLGAIHLLQDRPAEAAGLMARSLEIEPRQPAAHLNLGVALQALDRHAEAAECFGRAIALKPDYAGAYFNQALSLRALRRMDEACLVLERLAELAPNHAEAHGHLGAAYEMLGRLDAAAASYLRAAACKPDYLEAHYNGGVALQALGRYDEALACYNRALALKPDIADAYNNRGVVLRQLRRYPEALADFDRVLMLDPDRAATHYNRAIALKEIRHREAALASVERALALMPDHAEAHNERGAILQSLNRYEEALAEHDHSLTLNPALSATHCQRGVALHFLGRYREALDSHDRAIALAPDDPYGYWNKAMLLLLLGRYEEGWRLYEWRWRRDEMRGQQRHADRPLWLGEADIAGKTLLVHAEQGLGDSLQYCRYLPLLRARGIDVVFEAPAALVEICASLGGDIAVVAKDGPLPAFDYQCPVMSLPLAFGTTLADIPAPPAYLTADEARCRQWAERLGPAKGLRVGIAWSGNAAQANDHNRSLMLAQLAPLLAVDVQWHSLQKDVRAVDLPLLAELPTLHDWRDELGDFMDTAALMMQMDLVISVCTSVAHLAAALGRPTWVMLPHVADQRWLVGRDDSPWYPTVRLFRQPGFGEWPQVVQRVADTLAAHARP